MVVADPGEPAVRNFFPSFLSILMMSMQLVKRTGLVAVVFLSLALAPSPWARAAEDSSQSDARQEAEIGKQASAEIEAEFALVQDKDALDKLEALAKTIAAVSERPEVNYTCKIIDSKEVNAFSVPGGTILPNGEVQPGGFIYVTRGLLDFVRSDDELAAVLAHEIGHQDHHDALRQLEEYNRHSKDAFLAALLGMWLGRGDTNAAGAAYLAGQLVQEAKTHSYTITLEKEADLAAVEYLRKTDYSPVGLLTFLERLDALGVTDPNDMGIFQDHPTLVERTIYVSERLSELGIPINRRKVAGGDWAVIANTEEGKVTRHRVLIGDQVIFDPAPDENCEQRALDVVKNVNQLLKEGLETYETQVVPNKVQGYDVVARGATLLSYLPSDGRFFGKSPEQLATDSKQALAQALWKESFPTTEKPGKTPGATVPPSA